MRLRVAACLAALTLCLPCLASAPGQASKAADAEASPISLAGKWGFRLDAKDVGVAERWFSGAMSDTVNLPGSTDEAGKGTPNSKPTDLWYLSRKWEYVGAAWYSREVDVPAAWAGKRALLTLERCHWETQVWIDGRAIDMLDSLSVAHERDLGALKPGKHRLALRIHNRLKHDVGAWAHSVTEHTQTNWNGVVGRMQLRPVDPVSIETVQTYPDVLSRSVRVRVKVRNRSGAAAAGTLVLSARTIEAKPAEACEPTRLTFRAEGESCTVETLVKLSRQAKVWDEFSPDLTQLYVDLTASAGGGRSMDTARVRFGLRDFRVGPGKRFILNGRPVFLRGTLECCIFPLTGYPSMDVAAWRRILVTCKSYGLNHIRFHSWCPPEAAFSAADEAGFMLQIEAPFWVNNWGRNAERDKWAGEEVLRILDAYGNHPSFALMSMGNEPGGDYKVIQAFVKQAKAHDPRHVYTAGSGWGSGPDCDYQVTPDGRGIRGPSTQHDIREQVTRRTVPMVEHEIGQWQVFPNLAEIPKYKGVLEPRNLSWVRGDLSKKGLLAQAADFTHTSGKLSALLYKEEIEVLLRTPGHGGFALLDLHDFPGQGTATVGMLDAFWEPKGVTTPRDFRRFCAPVVPLLRVPKRVYRKGETLTGLAEVANFGPFDLRGAKFQWKLKDAAGAVVGVGAWPARVAVTGQLTMLGRLEASLEDVPAPAKLNLAVGIPGTDIENDWDIWVYPSAQAAAPSPVLLATRWDKSARDTLAQGGSVLLMRSRPAISVPGRFETVFWDSVMFKGQPFTMGLLCDPSNPAFRRFPTESHTNWQWYELLAGVHCMVLDGLPRELRPLVQMVDAYNRNKKLGLMFEAQIGKGKLIATSLDLTRDPATRPAAAQLLTSVLEYMRSEDFRPVVTLTEDQVNGVMGDAGPSWLGSHGARVASVDSADPANPAANAIDGDPETIWHTAWGASDPPYPHEICIESPESIRIAGIRYVPRQDISNSWIRRYEVYVSDDGKTWGAPVAKGDWPQGTDAQTVRFRETVSGRFLRLVALEGFDGKPWAGVAELDVIAAK